MLDYLKILIRSGIKRLGFHLSRYNPHTDSARQLKAVLDMLEVNLVLDVGANVGQFGSELRAGGYIGRIMSFEPLEKEHLELIAVASADLNWEVYDRCAIGDFAGEAEINVSRNSVSSSMLDILAAHTNADESSSYFEVQRVPVLPLDQISADLFDDSDRVFLKIDTQGFESQVLDGAAKTIPKVAGIVCELSLVELYSGQAVWRDLIDRLECSGFTVWTILRGFSDVSTGRSLQIDVIFVRGDLLNLH